MLYLLLHRGRDWNSLRDFPQVRQWAIKGSVGLKPGLSGLISLLFFGHSTEVHVKFYGDKSLSVSKVSKMALTRPCPFLFHTFVSARVSWGCSAQSLWLKTAAETRGKHLLKISGTLEHNVCGLLGGGRVCMTWSGHRDSFGSPQKASLSVTSCPWEAPHTWSQNQGQKNGLIFPLRNEKTSLRSFICLQGRA